MTQPNKPTRRAVAAIIFAGIVGGSTFGCAQSKPAGVTPTTPAASQPAASAPAASRPAVPDPREAQYLTDVTQLTEGFAKAGEGYFSPDMKWVVFQATPPGEQQYQMYVAPLDVAGGDGGRRKLGMPIRISPPNSRNTCGFFSPDGKSLIFSSTAGKEKPDEPNAGYQRQGGNYRWAFPDGMEIYKAPLDVLKTSVERAAGGNSPMSSFYELVENTDLTTEFFSNPATRPSTLGTPVGYSDVRINSGGARPTFIAQRADRVYHDVIFEASLTLDLAIPANRLTDNDAYDAEGSFSPDGKWICFTSRRSGDTEVWVMRADGSDPVQITHAKGYDGGPFFSPDGKRLVYRSDRKGNDLLQIFVADLAFDGTGKITGVSAERQLTDDANVNWGPYFHPDGKHIVYATSIHGHHNYELYLMRDDGSKPTRITYCAGFDGLPAFSPDGKYLMWSSKRTKDDTTQLFIAKYHAPKE